MLQNWALLGKKNCWAQLKMKHFAIQHISNTPDVLIQIYMTFCRVLHMTTVYYDPNVLQHVPCDNAHNSHVTYHMESRYSAQASHLKLTLQPATSSCIVQRLSGALWAQEKCKNFGTLGEVQDIFDCTLYGSQKF